MRMKHQNLNYITHKCKFSIEKENNSGENVS